MSEAKNILVVEDEAALRDTLAYNLKHEGYSVKTAGDGRTALETVRRESPDLIVMDIMLPGIDGFETTRILREETNVPILMLTAKDAEIDRVLGLEIGADDYLTKPFSMREFLARVKAMLRRVKLTTKDAKQEEASLKRADQYIFGNLVINTIRHEVSLEGQAINLKPKEYELLLFLARHLGEVLSRDLILERVWGWEFIGGTRTVDVHVRWLRSKIEQDPSTPIRIITVRGAGYRFEG